MRFIGSFYQFAQRVLQSAKDGKLPRSDVMKLKRLLDRTAKRNLILAKGILSALNAGGAKEADISKLSLLLEKANERINSGKEPFTSADTQELADIFNRAYISAKAANWFTTQMDELLAEEIDEFIKGKRSIGRATKKTVPFEEKTPEKQKSTAKN